jgi:hypothetical protein
MDKNHTIYNGIIEERKGTYPSFVVVRRIAGKRGTSQETTRHVVQIDYVTCSTLAELDNVIDELIKARMVLEVALRGDHFGPECICRALPEPDLGYVQISSEDSCPVHGFGTP